MQFVGRKIVRDMQEEKEVFSVKINPVTSKIKFSTTVVRKLNLAGALIGFGYDPDTTNPISAGIFVTQNGDTNGCKVSDFGDTQSKYHCELLSRTYNGGRNEIFSLSISVTATNINGTDVYMLSQGETIIEENVDNLPVHNPEII